MNDFPKGSIQNCRFANVAHNPATLVQSEMVCSKEASDSDADYLSIRFAIFPRLQYLEANEGIQTGIPSPSCGSQCPETLRDACKSNKYEPLAKGISDTTEYPRIAKFIPDQVPPYIRHNLYLLHSSSKRIAIYSD